MKKLYVIVRKDLSPEQIAVQAGHGVAQFLLEHNDHGWDNGTLVYLGVPDEQGLKKQIERLTLNGINFSTFIEPDIGDEITSIAAVSEGKQFKRLSLLRI